MDNKTRGKGGEDTEDVDEDRHCETTCSCCVREVWLYCYVRP